MRSRLLSAHLVVALLYSAPLFASRSYRVGDAVAMRLELGVEHGETLHLDRVPLINGDPATLDLERFEVWDAESRVTVHEADGKTTHVLPRSAARFYRGSVAGESDSAIAISVEPDGQIEGTIFVRERVFSIASATRLTGAGTREPHAEDPAVTRDRTERAVLLVREIDPVADLVINPAARDWHCDIDQASLNSVRKALSGGAPSAAMESLRVSPQGTPSSGVAYSLKLAIETDGELRAAFGSDAALQSYIGNLIAQVSVIYQRDLNTTVTAGTVNVWASPLTDPWSINPAFTTADALSELAAYWHTNNSGVSRSAVVFISGKPFFAGSAWQDFLCQPEVSCGVDGSQCGSAAFANSYAGAYAFCASTVVTTSVPDPTLAQNGVQYGLPPSNYWMLLEVAHELGHLANGPHTHCVPLTAAQQTQYGVSRSYIDQCFNGEPGCYSGSSISAPAEKGTIMSLCHNIFAGAYPQSRYLFYKAGEPSELLVPWFQDGLNHATAGVDATITVGSNLTCSAQTASVPAGAAAYAWSITGGTIDSGGNTRQPTFTPSAANVTLTATVSNANGCAVINAKTTTTQCGGPVPAAPTNVAATATGLTTVAVTWTGVSGATSYAIRRSSDHINYAQVGTSTTPSFSDPTASANTAYLYRVRAINGAGASLDSAVDLATTVIFADSTLTVGVTIIKAQHINDLRTAVSAVRSLAGIGPYSFTDATLIAGATPIKAIHFVELRTALDQARSALTLSAISYTDPTITVGVTTVKAQHIYDLRNGTQ
ncbi:MAG TPA: M12 family metallo-peptidase [Thermoanaerobaculia bacterium]|nr:M12 family metallo-peptidase [Thermoanaerobaculia bacterium]